MDIWEANFASTAYTAHPCRTLGPKRCEGDTAENECGDTPPSCKCCSDDDVLTSCPCCGRYKGLCDKDGCDFNSYRMGEHSFYGFGPNFTVDTRRPVTVVTQFLTDDGTDDGDLVEIRRLYVQDGRVINNSFSTVLGRSASDSISGDYCKAQKGLFQNPDDFTKKGGLKTMGETLDRGMVLVLSLWDDKLTRMDWLDSSVGGGKFPLSKPGVVRGPCPAGSGDAQELRKTKGDAFVRYSGISYGEIGSTFGPGSERLIYPSKAPSILVLATIAIAGMAVCAVAGLFAMGRVRRNHSYSAESPRSSFVDSESGIKPLVSPDD
mmetsp:Transcript_109279/g.339305  ORF Transcript_109279/g.339305 Transcript_109279/m.339305 type:complete len:321 (+) Transcript_109279:3-965(+)